MKVLFIGGNGNISWQCTQQALEHGHDVWQLNREQSVLTRRKVQTEVKKIKADIRETEKIKRLMENCFFDVVCDFICFNEEQAQKDIEVFRKHTKHFVFISSESVYKRESYNIPYKENSDRYDLYTCDSSYICGKIKAENTFMEAYKNEGFPVTIIRPAYTYDTIFPISIGHNCFTAAELIKRGYPLLIAGDGCNLWTFTHSSDFASAFIGLIENPDTIGKQFHISTEEWLTWNEQSDIVLRTLQAEKSGIFHVPFEAALELSDIQPREMMFQRMWHNIYCVDKVKEYVSNWSARVPFEDGIQKTVNWLNENKNHKRYVDNLANELMKIYGKYGIEIDEKM